MKCLIVGQGIAGAVLAWSLARRGVSVHVADAGFVHTSSPAAAGIINPVTGKRIVKSWRFDTFFPAARRTYMELETALNCPIWQELPMIRLLPDAEACNQWAARLALPDYSAILGERSNAGSWSGLLAPALGYGEIRQSARVDFPALLDALRVYFMARDCFLNQKITPDAAAVEQARHFDYVIFCEGASGVSNPFFPGLPWQLSKGESLLFRLKGPEAGAIREMVKHQLTLVPLGDGLFWAGATYRWDFEDGGPTDSDQTILEKQLSAMLNSPFEVVQRFGAVRPTVKDRRPLLGISPVHPKMVLFNGLGTKGALLAPYWAEHLAAHLLEGAALDGEVDIRR